MLMFSVPVGSLYVSSDCHVSMLEASISLGPRTKAVWCVGTDAGSGVRLLRCSSVGVAVGSLPSYSHARCVQL